MGVCLGSLVTSLLALASDDSTWTTVFAMDLLRVLDTDESNDDADKSWSRVPWDKFDMTSSNDGRDDVSDFGFFGTGGVSGMERGLPTSA